MLRKQREYDGENLSEEEDAHETCETVQDVQAQEEPISYEEAMDGPDAEKWRIAMDEELNSLMSNNTWSVQQLPKGKSAVGCKWVFKIKRHADGRPDRYKARLVAQGFSQKFGTDYNEVFAPVVRHATFRMLLSIAVHRKFVVKHFDAKTAFLNGKLEEEIFMKQPPGFNQTGREEFVCKL
uniref:Reverse transcriptase Ty1/copia-type domain-containing protein n=1 Tax=Bracon brevicornis TaxID=1563983 RepID=A0A6V7JMB6_9HYME